MKDGTGRGQGYATQDTAAWSKTGQMSLRADSLSSVVN